MIQLRMPKSNNGLNAGSFLLFQLGYDGFIKIRDGMIIIRCTQFRAVCYMVVNFGTCVEFLAAVKAVSEVNLVSYQRFDAVFFESVCRSLLVRCER